MHFTRCAIDRLNRALNVASLFKNDNRVKRNFKYARTNMISCWKIEVKLTFPGQKVSILSSWSMWMTWKWRNSILYCTVELVSHKNTLIYCIVISFSHPLAFELSVVVLLCLLDSADPIKSRTEWPMLPFSTERANSTLWMCDSCMGFLKRMLGHYSKVVSQIC